jgi:hypothetical protein
LSSAVAAMASVAMLASPAVAATAAPKGLVPYGQLDCRSGPIEPGTYISILVIGNCWLTDFGVVVVNGDFRVAHDARFSAQNGGTMIVDGNFYSGTNSVTDMGQAGSNDVVMGNVYSDNSYEMWWQYVTVGGWYYVVGQNGYSDNTNCVQDGLTGAPATETFEHGSVGSYFAYKGNMSCTIGLFSSRIGGNVYYDSNTVNSHPGSIAVGSNTIGGSLECGTNSQTPVLGGGMKKNVVKGKATAQCAKL